MDGCVATVFFQYFFQYVCFRKSGRPRAPICSLQSLLGSSLFPMNCRCEAFYVAELKQQLCLHVENQRRNQRIINGLHRYICWIFPEL